MSEDNLIYSHIRVKRNEPNLDEVIKFLVESSAKYYEDKNNSTFIGFDVLRTDEDLIEDKQTLRLKFKKKTR